MIVYEKSETQESVYFNNPVTYACRSLARINVLGSHFQIDPIGYFLTVKV